MALEQLLRPSIPSLVHEWVPAAGALSLELMIAARVFDPLNFTQQAHKPVSGNLLFA